MNKSLLTLFAVPFLSLAITSLASAQLISNGGFESAIVSGGSGSGNWGSFGNASQGTTAFAHSGTGASKYFGTFPGTSGVYQNFAAVAGQSFDAAGFGYNLSTDAMQANNAAFIRVTFFNAGGTELTSGGKNSGNIDINTPVNTWTPLSIKAAIAPVGTDHGQILVLFTQPGSNGGAAYFDDVTLNVTPVPEPATFAVLGLGLIPVLRRRRR